MTRTQARRRRKRRQKLRQIGAWTLLLVAELFAAAVPSALVAAVLLPFAWWERGYRECYGSGNAPDRQSINNQFGNT